MSSNLEEISSIYDIGLSIVAYSLCSSTMLLANKIALSYLPLPSVVSVMQITFAAAAVFVLKYGLGVKIDDIEMEKLKPYALYIVAFVTAIFANMQALNVSNVETVVVFRASTPLATTIIEYIFMGRSFPTIQSLVSMSCVAIGALVYCLSDSQFALEGLHAYKWVLLYYVLIVFEMTYAKQLTRDIKMISPTWGPTLYQNLLAIVPMMMLGALMGDFHDDTLNHVLEIPFSGAVVIIFSCITGTMIGYTGWKLRGAVSATTFTLVGVVNKFLTILLNVIVWDKHSSSAGVAAVCVCLLAGAFYRQAPMRELVVAESIKNEEIELRKMENEESKPLMKL
jgi:drug/metabolite transporter (DMT)-like permease